VTDFNHYDNFLPSTEKKETKLNGFTRHVDLFVVLKDHCHHQILVLGFEIVGMSLLLEEQGSSYCIHQ
jgi:hypothetical protein